MLRITALTELIRRGIPGERRASFRPPYAPCLLWFHCFVSLDSCVLRFGWPVIETLIHQRRVGHSHMMHLVLVDVPSLREAIHGCMALENRLVYLLFWRFCSLLSFILRALPFSIYSNDPVLMKNSEYCIVFVSYTNARNNIATCVGVAFLT